MLFSQGLCGFDYENYVNHMLWPLLLPDKKNGGRLLTDVLASALHL